MNKPIPFINELVSFAVLIMMVIALVAGEADATMHEAARAEAARSAAVTSERSNVPFSTTLSTRIAGQPLTISIDAVAEFSLVSFDDQ